MKQKYYLIFGIGILLILISGCVQQTEQIQEKYIPLLKEVENPLCNNGVCYVKNSNVCPDGYIYEHHPIQGDSCVLICSKEEVVTFVPLEVPTDASPFPCHCLNDWKGDYEPRDKPQTFMCEG